MRMPRYTSTLALAVAVAGPALLRTASALPTQKSPGDHGVSIGVRRDTGSSNYTLAVDKRSHSVPPWGSPELNDSVGSEDVFPWPPLSRMYPADKSLEAHYHWIRYCFTSESAASTLSEYLLHAIAMFGPAMEYSSLRIGMDYSCTEPRTCICTPGITSPDDLHILDAPDSDSDFEEDVKNPNSPEEEKGKGTFVSSGTTGWRRTDVRQSGTWEHNRMTIILGKDEMGRKSKAKQEEARQEQVLNVVHELAHVAGLFHEHQRPDAADFIDFKCENLMIYEDAEKKVLESNSKKFSGLNREERMKKICTDWTVLERPPRGLTAATDVIRDMIPYVGKVPDGPTVWSREYDYLSMTHYSSDTGMKDDKDADGQEAYTLFRRQDHATHQGSGTSLVIWQGGSQHLTKRALSVGDVIRIAELYPINKEMTAKAEQLRHTGWQERVVKVGTVTTTVRPAETPALGKGPHTVPGRAPEQHFALGPWVAVKDRAETKPRTWGEVAGKDHGLKGNYGGQQYGD